MRLSNTHKVGHRAYDNLLITMIEQINSFISREELVNLFSDSLFELSSFSYLAVLISAIMLSYEHYLINKDFKNIPKAFFDINGILGIIFLILISLDKVLKWDL